MSGMPPKSSLEPTTALRRFAPRSLAAQRPARWANVKGLGSSGRRLAVALTLVTLTACGASSNTPDVAPSVSAAVRPVTSGQVVADVRSGFEAYRSALLNRDGERAAQSVTKSTLVKYEEYRGLALTGDETTVKGLSLVHRLTVLMTRHRVALSDLQNMDGRALFQHGVEQGWISQASVAQVELGDIAVSGNTASAEAGSAGEQVGRFVFVKEQDRWKLDLTKLITASEPALQAAVAQQRVSENEFLFRVIGATTGRTVTDTIWKPLQ